MAVTFLTNEDKIARYDEQTLTEEQKAQARENIGAVSATEVTAIVDAKISAITNAEEVAY